MLYAAGGALYTAFSCSGSLFRRRGRPAAHREDAVSRRAIARHGRKAATQGRRHGLEGAASTRAPCGCGRDARCGIGRRAWLDRHTDAPWVGIRRELPAPQDGWAGPLSDIRLRLCDRGWGRISMGWEEAMSFTAGRAQRFNDRMAPQETSIEQAGRFCVRLHRGAGRC